MLEINQLYHCGLKKYFTDPQNYFQVVTYAFVIIFVFPLGHECWCYPSWRWQIGALAIFLAWINNFLLLKHIPYIGKPVTMLFNAYLNFILLIYLPILLIAINICLPILYAVYCIAQGLYNNSYS